MSVINKMLQDLEQRQQSGVAASCNTTAPKPVAGSRNRLLWLALLLAVLVVAGWLWQGNNSQSVSADNSGFTESAQAEPAHIVAALQTESAEIVRSVNVKQQLEVQPIVDAMPTVEVQALVEVAHAEPARPAELKPQALTQAKLPVIASVPATELPPAVKPQATVNKQPLSAEAEQHNMQLRASASEAAGDTSGAIVIWQHIIASQPANEQGYLNLARLWLKQQQVVSASQVLLQARQNGVQSARINMQLAQLAVRQGEWQQALEFLPDQFELAAEPEYYGFKATVLQQLQQYEVAFGWYLRLVQLQPEQGRWSLGAALVSEQLGQSQQAYQHYQQAWQHRQVLSASSHDFIQQRLKATEP